MNSNYWQWKYGVKDGIPICLGYFAVSFTFGIMASGSGLTPLQAVVMSAANLTSAGQFAALGIISASASYTEMAVTQLIINLRYCLMSCSLSQKLDSRHSFLHRFPVAYGVTDEIFGVSVCKPGRLSPFYNYGLITAAVPGWAGGTLFGAVCGDILPGRVISALSVALYGMFLAVIIPPAKGNRVLTGVILASMGLSFLFTKLPVVSSISSGFRIILLTVLIAGGAAFLFPVKEESHEK